MCTLGARFPFWFDPKGVRSFFVYMWHNILEYLKPMTCFLVGILLRLARWWVSRAGALHHPARISPLQILGGNISAFVVCGPFHQLLICLKFCHQSVG